MIVLKNKLLDFIQNQLNKKLRIFTLNNFNYFQISKTNMELNKKRNREESENKNNNKQEANEFDDFSDSENNEEIPEGVTRVNMPKKAKYRMRAHINPLSEITIQ